MRRIPFPGNSYGVWQNLTRATSYLHSGLGRADLTIPLPFPLPTLPNPITPKAFIESLTTVFQTCFGCRRGRRHMRHRSWRSTSRASNERKIGQWDNMTWEEYIGANRASAEYNRYLADGIIRNLAASKSRDASAHSIGLVGEASVWSILLLGQRLRQQGVRSSSQRADQLAVARPWVQHLRSLGVTFQVGKALVAPDRPTAATSRRQRWSEGNGVPETVVADWYVSAVPCEKLAAVLTPDVIAMDPKLANVARLRTEWMNGLMFYLKERVDVTKGHVNYVDSGWGITSISEEQFWKTEPDDVRRRHRQRLSVGDHFGLVDDRETSTARAPATACPRRSPARPGRRSRRT